MQRFPLADSLDAYNASDQRVRCCQHGMPVYLHLQLQEPANTKARIERQVPRRIEYLGY
jgi:hypothetical protein